MSEEEFYAPIVIGPESLPENRGVQGGLSGLDNQGAGLPQETSQESGPQDLEISFQNWAAEAQLTPYQERLIKGRYEALLKQSQAGMEEIAPGLYANPGMFATTKAAATSELKRQLGPTYESGLNQAKAMVRRFGGVDLVRLLDATGLGNAPVMVRAWVAVANAVGGGSGYTPSGLTGAAGLQAELDLICRDPGLLDRHHPEHKKLIRRRDEIMAKFHPGYEEG